MEREEYGDSTSCRNFGEARERDEQLSLSLARLCASGPTSGIFCAPQQEIAKKKKEKKRKKIVLHHPKTWKSIFQDKSLEGENIPPHVCHSYKDLKKKEKKKRKK